MGQITQPTAVPQQTDSSVVFARLGQCALRWGHIAMCPPMGAHWRHLANTIELVLPLAHQSLQPKQQIVRLNHFCTDHGRVSLGTLAPPSKYDWTCEHWCHPAIMIELELPSAHPSPQPKWQVDRLSCFCTAHGRKSLCFTMGDPFPQNCPFSWEDLDPI